MLKKLFLVLMVGVMMISCAACGNTEKDSGETVTLTWLIPGDEQPDTALVMEEVNKIIEPAIGVKLDLKFIAQSAYSEKMKMNMASGGDFDLCFTSNWLNIYTTAARSGGLYDITELIDDELRATMADKIWDASKIDGKIYAVPNNQVMFRQLAVGFRKDLLEKYEFDINTVNHIEDIEPFLEIIKQNEPDVYPYNNRFFTTPWTQDIIGTISGADWAGMRYDTNEVVVLDEQPEVLAAAEKIREWYQKGYIRSDFASAGGDTNTTDINQGKYATQVNVWKPGMDFFSNATVPYVYKPFTDVLFGTPTAAMTGISASCKYPEKAMELIKLVNTNKEVYNLICYGIEGTHYTLNAEGKLETIENSGYKSQGDWKYGNQFNAHLTAGMDDNVWEETERLNNEAKVSPISDFAFDTTPVRTEAAQVSATNSEYDFKGWTTAKDGEKFVTERKSAREKSGYLSVFEEVKKQVAEHISGK